MDIIVLNAPPQSGKDEISAYLCKGNPNINHEEVKELLFEVAIRSAGNCGMQCIPVGIKRSQAHT